MQQTKKDILVALEALKLIRVDTRVVCCFDRLQQEQRRQDAEGG
jgi:hypothetical protein